MWKTVLSARRLALLTLALAAFAVMTALPAAAGPAATVAPTADAQPPSVPQGMAFSGRSRTTVSLVWRAARDNVGVTGYRLFRNNAPVATTRALKYTYAGLRCGTSYTFALEAFDAAGNASYRPQAVGTTSTLACATATPKPPPKPTPPPRPAAPVKPPKSGLAHVWVDTNGGSCRRSATPRAYANALTCGSVAAAYNAAAAGDTIVVAGGTYGRQVIPNGSKRVTIRNAPGARPVFGTTEVHASNLSLIGVNIVRNDDPGSATATLEARGDNNTFRGVRVDTRNMPVRQGVHADGNHNLFHNGSSANVVDEKGVLVAGSFVTFDNFNVHDVKVTNSSVHNECVYSLGPNLTFRNSRFWNCATMALFITRGNWWNQPLYGGVTLINTVFGHSTNTGPGSWHYYALGINGGVIQEMRNWRVINNTFETEVSGDGTPAPGTIWANNVGDWSCYPGAIFTGNVGKKCSASDKAVAPAASCAPPACSRATTGRHGWVDPSRNDFHLTAKSPAINAANPAYAPARDKDGRLRRVGPRPDAGAYEFVPVKSQT